MGQSLDLHVVRDLPIVVQDFDDSPASRELIDTFRGVADVSHHRRGRPDRNPEEAFADEHRRAARWSSRATSAATWRAAVDAPVQLLVDGSDANTARLLAGYAGGVTALVQRVAHGAGGGQAGGVQTAHSLLVQPVRCRRSSSTAPASS